MELKADHVYIAAPDAVFDALTDREALLAKYAGMGHRNVEIREITTTPAGGTRVRNHRVVPMDVPGFLRKFLSPTTAVDQTDEWGPANAEGVRSGTWTAKSAGVPVDVGGTLRLAPRIEGGTTVTITATVKSGVPLVGGKLADFVAGSVRATLDQELAENRKWLQAHPA